MSRQTITEFLEARLAEDEVQAEAASVSMHGERHENQRHYGSYILSSERDSTEAQDEFILEWWPARVLAECAAKRARLQIIEGGWIGYNDDNILGDLLALEAAPYKDHPDYDESWVL